MHTLPQGAVAQNPPFPECRDKESKNKLATRIGEFLPKNSAPSPEKGPGGDKGIARGLWKASSDLETKSTKHQRPKHYENKLSACPRERPQPFASHHCGMGQLRPRNFTEGNEENEGSRRRFGLPSRRLPGIVRHDRTPRSIRWPRTMAMVLTPQL